MCERKIGFKIEYIPNLQCCQSISIVPGIDFFLFLSKNAIQTSIYLIYNYEKRYVVVFKLIFNLYFKLKNKKVFPLEIKIKFKEKS